jgi:hypothetical protein
VRLFVCACVVLVVVVVYVCVLKMRVLYFVIILSVLCVCGRAFCVFENARSCKLVFNRNYQ